MNNTQQLSKDIIHNTFDAFNDFNVLIIGDIMLDTYVWGKVERISPEAPVPVLSFQKQEDKLGGAANVVKNIHALGANPTLCSVIGNDLNGKKIVKLFEQHHLNTEGIIIDNNRKTTGKTRFLSGFHHLLRLDEEDTNYINISTEEALYDKIIYLLSEQTFHAIIFQDYDKGVLTPKLIEKVINLANKKQIHTVVDPKKRNFSAYRGTTLFKPNRKEFLEGIGADIAKDDLSRLGIAAEKLRKKLNFKILLLTLSSNGILVCSTEKCSHIPAETQEISDVSGAGDTVIATATLCLIANLPPQTIGIIANIAGGLVCKHPVIVSVNKKELLREVLTKKQYI